MSIIPIYLLSLLTLMAVSILVLRIFVRRDYLQKRRLSYASAALQALIFFAYGSFSAIYLPGDWPVVHVVLPLRLTGLSFLSTGLVIMFLCIYRLGILRSCGLQTTELKDSSLYQVTRNPQVVGCVLYLIGFTVLWPSWFALVWGLSLLVILHIMVLTEEEHLSNAFGQVYDEYCKHVPRYLGCPKKSS
jgi:protein-S-isoprenylcysteine O-methyltransferase Ste14